MMQIGVRKRGRGAGGAPEPHQRDGIIQLVQYSRYCHNTSLLCVGLHTRPVFLPFWVTHRLIAFARPQLCGKMPAGLEAQPACNTLAETTSEGARIQ